VETNFENKSPICPDLIASRTRLRHSQDEAQPQPDLVLDNDINISSLCSNEPTSSVQRLRNYMTEMHFHHIQIPVHLLKVIGTLIKAKNGIKTYVKNVYQQSLIYNRDDQRENRMDKQYANLAALLIKDRSDLSRTQPLSPKALAKFNNT
jgi:hypothetical protein